MICAVGGWRSLKFWKLPGWPTLCAVCKGWALLRSSLSPGQTNQLFSFPRRSKGQAFRLQVVSCDVGREECVAPTVLRILLLGLPALTHWANFCRASGATRTENSLKPGVTVNAPRYACQVPGCLHDLIYFAQADRGVQTPEGCTYR